MAQTSIKDLPISGSILRKRIWIILQSQIIKKRLTMVDPADVECS